MNNYRIQMSYVASRETPLTKAEQTVLLQRAQVVLSSAIRSGALAANLFYDAETYEIFGGLGEVEVTITPESEEQR